MVEKRKVVWSSNAKQQLKEACTYIAKDSVQNAKKVKSDIVKLTRKLPAHPERYNPDKYKINNDGSFRAFEKHRYRVVYQLSEKEIRILHLRHTSMLPINY